MTPDRGDFEQRLAEQMAEMADTPLPGRRTVDQVATVASSARRVTRWALPVAAAVVVGTMGAVLLVALRNGPTTAPGSSSDATASSTPQPTPSEEPVPAAPASAVVEKDGIGLKLDLDRDRLSFGKRVWAEVTVTNTGTDVVHWGHSGTCPFEAVELRTDLPLSFPYGRTDWVGELDVLKGITVDAERSTIPGGETAGWFDPEPFVDRTTSMYCTLDLVTDVLQPGERLTYRAAWDADGPGGMPMPPAEYAVTATFAYVGRGDIAQDAASNDQTVSVDLSLTVDTPSQAYLAPGEAVDQVLADPSFLTHFEDAPRSRWQESTIAFEGGVWMMRLHLETPAEAIVASVDALTGEVLSVALDPNPPPPIY
jgi:hypothetical protein